MHYCILDSSLPFRDVHGFFLPSVAWIIMGDVWEPELADLNRNLFEFDTLVLGDPICCLSSSMDYLES